MDGADIILLAVKPQNMANVTEELAGCCTTRAVAVLVWFLSDV